MMSKAAPLEFKYIAHLESPSVPSKDRRLLGHAHLEESGSFEVRSYQTFTVHYTVGRLGIDDAGGVKLIFRPIGDWGALQTSEPDAPNFVSITTNGDASFNVSYESWGHTRPWNKCLTAKLANGTLCEGDRITVTIGDKSKGSPGFLMQTFAETIFSIRVLVDAKATGHYVVLDDKLSVRITPGPAVRWKVALPTCRPPGQEFFLGIKAEDVWGNPTDQGERHLTLHPNLPVKGLPEAITYQKGQFSRIIEGLSVESDGTLRIELHDDDGLVATSNPMVVRPGTTPTFWGDLHGQSGETIGINSADEYYEFARDRAFLDAVSHQGNDFQISGLFWRHLNELSDKYHVPHRFVTFPGYEWSGNTSAGGDRNVYYLEEGRPIYRSGHALLSDQSDIDNDAYDANELFERLAEEQENAIVFAHCGGRYADLGYSHDGVFETAVEIHSDWGTFEWILADAFENGYRVGIVANSDGHKGRPGASYPGAAHFGAYGGVTCFISEDLTREALFECMRRRHHYGTTGHRLHLEVRAELPPGSLIYPRDPALFDVTGEPAETAIMGDIVSLNENRLRMRVCVAAAEPVERVVLRRGMEVMETYRPYTEKDLGNRIQLLVAGARYRGRGRQVNWSGTARFEGTEITGMDQINVWNPDLKCRMTGPSEIEFDAITTGNFSGLEVTLADLASATLHLDTNVIEGVVPLGELDTEAHVLPAGALEREVRLVRLPNDNNCLDAEIEFEVPLEDGTDNPLWINVFTEDGGVAWSSPIYGIVT